MLSRLFLPAFLPLHKAGAEILLGHLLKAHGVGIIKPELAQRTIAAAFEISKAKGNDSVRKAALVYAKNPSLAFALSWNSGTVKALKLSC